MQRIFIGQTGNVTSSNKLNCTANDIRISRATAVSPSSCIEGTHFDLTATFETIVTANARYDAGFFFRTDGGTSARGDGNTASGVCSLSALTPGQAPALDLDGDTCGDLNAGTYSLTFTIPQVLCAAAPGTNLLRLPNCTSWHSNQATACTITNQFDFHPDTKSKCVCDDTFTVPVVVESPSGAVLKSATKAVVTYQVQVKNNSSTRTVKIDSLVDDTYGDLSAGAPPIQSTTCNTLIGTTVAPGATSSACTFTVQYNTPGTFGNVTDTVTAHVEDTQLATNTADFTGSATINVNLHVTTP
jgi:hypothetical protein